MRRFLVILGLVLVIFVAAAFATPSSLLDSLRKDCQETFNWFYQKKVTFSGLEFADESAVKHSVPLKNSNLWWKLNKHSVEESVASYPLVETSYVTECKDSAWNCYNVHIIEKKPFAVVRLADVFWLIDKKGTFLTPVRKDHPKALLELPLISGLAGQSASPELIKSRTGYACDAIRAIESAGTEKVERLMVANNGELHVKFKAHDYLVKFDSNSSHHLDNLNESLKRYAAVKSYIEGKEPLIEELDFAFDTQCVVKFSEQGKKSLKNIKLSKRRL